MILNRCGICKSGDLRKIYTPYRSKIGLQIFICTQCALVQASYDRQRFEKTTSVSLGENTVMDRLSCDADYSEIRVGKQQMADRPFEYFDKYLDSRSSVQAVLDMMSARGHFALRALDYFQLEKIHCIEPDKYMTETYKDNPRVELIGAKYHQYRPKIKFDLVYSCHTLEHYREPVKYFDYVASVLKDGGLFFLDVPNVRTIRLGNNYDEYFYDKHLFYFIREILVDYLSGKGFEVIAGEDKKSSVELLMRYRPKKRDSKWSASSDLAEKSKEIALMVSDYQKDIDTNRLRVAALVKRVNGWLDQKNSVAVVGCGRMFDCLIEYGGLDPKRFSYLIDNYLRDATSHIRGLALHRQNILSADPAVDGVLILTRFKNPSLMESIGSLASQAEIKHFTDFSADSPSTHCVIFDFDGTLADTSQGVYQSFSSACAAAGLKAPVLEDFRWTIGAPINELTKQFFPHITSEQLDLIVRNFRQRYDKEDFRGLHWYDGVIAGLRRLHKEGFKLAVVSNKPTGPLQEILKEAELSSLFHTMAGIDAGELAGGAKFESKKEALIWTLEKMNEEAKNVLHVGDKPSDKAASEILRMPFLPVGYGFHIWSVQDGKYVRPAENFEQVFSVLMKLHQPGR